tara:strand:+ start:1113 stop:1400 length:288 start_codon:yes stop_codon:yes gene_type:complete
MIETFKSLKNNDLIRVSMTDALFGKREKTLSIGRRSHSKKYNVEKLTMYQLNKDGSVCKHSCKYYFYYRPNSNLLSLAMNDMGCSFTSIEKIDTI